LSTSTKITAVSPPLGPVAPSGFASGTVVLDKLVAQSTPAGAKNSSPTKPTYPAIIKIQLGPEGANLLNWAMGKTDTPLGNDRARSIATAFGQKINADGSVNVYNNAKAGAFLAHLNYKLTGADKKSNVGDRFMLLPEPKNASPEFLKSYRAEVQKYKDNAFGDFVKNLNPLDVGIAVVTAFSARGGGAGSMRGTSPVNKTIKISENKANRISSTPIKNVPATPVRSLPGTTRPSIKNMTDALKSGFEAFKAGKQTKAEAIRFVEESQELLHTTPIKASTPKNEVTELRRLQSDYSKAIEAKYPGYPYRIGTSPAKLPESSTASSVAARPSIKTMTDALKSGFEAFKAGKQTKAEAIRFVEQSQELLRTTPIKTGTSKNEAVELRRLQSDYSNAINDRYPGFPHRVGGGH
jgi:hypothetical protein